MSLIFAKVVNMSISAGILILAVILVRLLFRKLPRKIFIIVPDVNQDIEPVFVHEGIDGHRLARLVNFIPIPA